MQNWEEKEEMRTAKRERKETRKRTNCWDRSGTREETNTFQKRTKVSSEGARESNRARENERKKNQQAG